jgi:hypothetical protein
MFQEPYVYMYVDAYMGNKKENLPLKLTFSRTRLILKPTASSETRRL